MHLATTLAINCNFPAGTPIIINSHISQPIKTILFHVIFFGMNSAVFIVIIWHRINSYLNIGSEIISIKTIKFEISKLMTKMRHLLLRFAEKSVKSQAQSSCDPSHFGASRAISCQWYHYTVVFLNFAQKLPHSISKN